MSLAIDIFMKLQEQRRKQGQIVVLLSAVVIMLEFADVRLEKIAVAGSEVTIKQPFVITGAIALMLLYNAIRHVTYVFGTQALAKTIPDFAVIASDMRSNTGFAKVCLLIYSTISTATAVMIPLLAIVALWAARHDMQMLAALVVRGLR